MSSITAMEREHVAYYHTAIDALKVGDTILLNDKPTCVTSNMDYGDHAEVQLLVAVEYPNLSVGTRVAWAESYKCAYLNPGYKTITGIRRSGWNPDNVYFKLDEAFGEYISDDIQVANEAIETPAIRQSMSEGDALMKFFAAAPGTWKGYRDDT